MPQEPNRTARIPPEALAIVERAAEIVLAAAEEAAHRAIEAPQVIRLSVADRRAFAEAILNPPEPAPVLRRAFSRHRDMIQESR